MARTSGLEYAHGVVGKHLYRVREIHVRDHLIPLMKQNAVGAAKLDLLLRGIAFSPQDVGNRPIPGLIIRRHRYEQLHDLVRPIDIFGDDVEDPDVRDLKREWVREQLVRLENLKLVERLQTPGRGPVIVVRKDDGTGDNFDDPDGGGGNSYVSITGGTFASGEMRVWGTPEVSFYLAAMIAERYETDRRRRHLGDSYSSAPIGGGQWFRPLGWFGDRDGAYTRPDSHILTPFSVPTLERGLRSLVDRELVVRHLISRDPLTKARFERRRNLYTNQFAGLVAEMALQGLTVEIEEYIAEAAAESDSSGSERDG